MFSLIKNSNFSVNNNSTSKEFAIKFKRLLFVKK